MAITSDYSGQTFVAFTDLSGFKAMMTNETRLIRAMDVLYSSGYHNLKKTSYQPAVEGIFISDCGILFVRKSNDNDDAKFLALDSLLQVLTSLHRDVFESAFALTTSVAYGTFAYRDKIEFEGIEKNAIHGHAYVVAFRDSENDKRKLYPNECRILKDTLPQSMTPDQIQEKIKIARGRIREEERYLYFEWMKKQ